MHIPLNKREWTTSGQCGNKNTSTYTKGQLISKRLFGVFNSSRKRTKTSHPEVSKMLVIIKTKLSSRQFLPWKVDLYCKCLQGITGDLQGKSAISMKRAVRITEKPYTTQRERLRKLWRNPMIIPCKHLQCIT